MTDKIRIAACLWFNKNAEEAAKFYAATFPDSRVIAVHEAPGDYPDGQAGAHDHPFEETFLILEGATDAQFDGETYRLEAGDVAWAGVGCVHGFTNAGPGPVRWLETQAPQPPARHSYRFARDWEYLSGLLGENGEGNA